MKKFLTILCAALILGMAGNTLASPIVLDFEGIGNLNPIGDFYNGGAGTDYGVAFSSNALAIVDWDAGGTGNFGGEPSADTTMFFLGGSAAIMSVAAGFDTGFSFYYAGMAGGYVNVYDGINGMGNILASLSIPETLNNWAGADPDGFFGPFEAIGVEFQGIAKSVAFGGNADQIGFDNVTFGSATPGGDNAPVPEPATIILLGSGLLGLGVRARKKFRK